MNDYDSGKWPGPQWPDFILDHLPLGLVVVDEHLRITFFNAAAQELTGYGPDEVQGRFCGNILEGGHCRLQCPLRTVLNREKASVDVETTVQAKDGRTIPVRLRTSGLFDDEGRLLGALEAFFDISRIKALEEEKSQTLSLFAHDMKGPLITIKGFVDRLLDGKAGDLNDKQSQYLQVVDKEVNRVEDLVLDFLDVARLGRQGAELAAEPVDLYALVEDLVEKYGPMAEDQGVSLTTHTGDDLPQIEADGRRLYRVMANLVENAVKYAGKDVRLNIEKADGGVQIEVLDRGPGLSDQDLAKVFEPFYRGDAGRTQEGTGLGLSAVKGVVEAHGGVITAENRPEGGARFVVQMPPSPNRSDRDEPAAGSPACDLPVAATARESD